MRQRLAAITVLAVLAVACAESTVGETSSTSQVSESLTTTSTSTTSATAEATTTTEAEPFPLHEFIQSEEFDRSFRLSVGVTYSLDLTGVLITLSPPIDGWELLGYDPNGFQDLALFGWRGLSGFRRDTLDVMIRRVDDEGTEAAWEHIEDQIPGFLGSDEWEWISGGIDDVDGRRVEWREVRTPPFSEEYAGDPGLGIVARTAWLPNTSARFYVVPVGDLTVTLMAFETRCACAPDIYPLLPASQQMDDVENELEMWIPELEAFLDAMSLAQEAG